MKKKINIEKAKELYKSQGITIDDTAFDFAFNLGKELADKMINYHSEQKEEDKRKVACSLNSGMFVGLFNTFSDQDIDEDIEKQIIFWFMGFSRSEEHANFIACLE